MDRAQVNKLRGTGVAIVTPFDEKGKIDFDAFGRVIDHVAEGVDYIVTMGTTGESVTLSDSEKRDVIRFVIDKTDGRRPVICGMGGNNTSKVLSFIEKADFSGLSGILSVCPYYNKPNNRGVYEHFRLISEASPAPVIMYNIPGRSAINIPSDVILKMAHEIPNIVAVKEASGDFFQIMDIIQKKPDNFLVLSGDDPLTLPLLGAGADGVISVIANAYPKSFSRMTHFAIEGKLREAQSIHYDLLPMIHAMFMDGNPAGIKKLLQIKGLCTDNVRLPLLAVDDETSALIKKLEEEIERD